jgi:septal ring factor EnvC (AmiA/AmiB activator)
MRRFAALAVIFALGVVPAAAQTPAPGGPTAASVAELERDLAHAESDEHNLAAELDEARPRLETTRRRLMARGRAYYKLVRAGLLPAGGGFDALVDHAAKVERARRSLERDVLAEATIVKHVAEIEGKLARARADKAPLMLQREAVSRARQALQEADERRAAFARAFETSVRPDAVAVYGTDMGPVADPTAGFRALRGRLPFPIAGRAEVERVQGASGPAFELLAPFGTIVRSVAAGRVAYADRQDEYGLTVIVDHGDRYYSLYASLGSADVRSGDAVPALSRIGTVGNVDGRRPRLYFELRHHATTIDPGPWLGL